MSQSRQFREPTKAWELRQLQQHSEERGFGQDTARTSHETPARTLYHRENDSREATTPPPTDTHPQNAITDEIHGDELRRAQSQYGLPRGGDWFWKQDPMLRESARRSESRSAGFHVAWTKNTGKFMYGLWDSPQHFRNLRLPLCSKGDGQRRKQNRE